MGFLQIIAFVGSGIGQFIILAVIIGMIIPESWLDVYGIIVASILVIMVLVGIIAFVLSFFIK